MNNKKNILVIGGNSFIAKNFISTYKADFDIFSVSRKNTGYQNEFIIANLFDLPESIFKNADVVINFAAIVHQPKIKNKKIYENINYDLPLFLAKMALNSKCSHFIQLSTIAVYGDTDYIDDKTKYSPINHYGEFKLKADDELKTLSKEGFIVTSVRPSMVYGGYNAPGNMNTFIKLVKKKLPLPFKGINNQRQFLNVNNLTQGLKGIIDQKLQGTILIADEEPVSTFELVNTISEAFNSKSTCFKLDFFWKIVQSIKPGIARKLIGNLVIKNTYSFEKLGIKPYSLKEGIKEMIVARKPIG